MKKITSLLLLILLLCSLLVSCVEKGEPSGDIPDKTVGGEETPEEKPEETSEEKPEETPVLPPVGTAVGNLFGDLTLETLSGESISTADYRGKIIILNVWATWCPPCKRELPDFNTVAGEYIDDVVVIAAHTYDEGKFDMPDYVATNFPNTDIIFAYDSDTSAVYRAVGGVGYVPHTAIIGKDGVILYSNYGLLTHDQLVKIIENNK